MKHIAEQLPLLPESNIERAKRFAHEAHDFIAHKRKYTGEPYWVHLDEVASIVVSVGGTEDMVIAAYLHDYREDVVTKLIELGLMADLARFEARYNEFSEASRNLVVELTDVYVKEAFPQMNRKERKEKERQRLATISAASQTIKLADFISNTRSIVQHDQGFARTYLIEKLAILPHMVQGNAALLNQASMQVALGCVTVGLNIPVISANM